MYSRNKKEKLKEQKELVLKSFSFLPLSLM